MEEIEKIVYHDELKANRLSVMFLLLLCGIYTLIWIANEVGVFVVNLIYMRIGMTVSFIFMLIPVIIFFCTKGRQRWFKYLLIVFVSLMSISIETFLTFHGVMLCVFPLLLAAQYPDSRIFNIAFCINQFGILFSVILGYYVGCWDGNMIYATTYGVTLAEDSFVARAYVMNEEYMKQLLLYFAMPRMVIFSTIALIISYILKTAKLQYVRQSMIRMEAEYDSLTKLENRNKYNYRVNGEYKNLQSIYVVFIDVNYLKKMNDTCGHEAGDAVLKNVAEEMKRIINKNIHGYRIGGDEFVLIFCNYNEDESYRLLKNWEKDIKPLNGNEYPVQCSLAIGEAYASSPFNLDVIIKKADDNMYKAKLAMKAQRVG